MAAAGDRTGRSTSDGTKGFDAFVEGLCAAFYAARMDRPSLRPGRYFRLLFIGYFEGLSSERGIAWRVADSLSLRSFLDLDVTEAAPDHSTLSGTRRLIDVETHVAVFTWVLERLSDAGLVRGKTVGIDATTLEANAAMRSIERRDTGESYEAFVRSLAEASGVETPTRADLARFDRSRKNKGVGAGSRECPQARADPGGRLQHRAAPASPDRRRHAPEPAGAGCFGDLPTGRAFDRPLGASDARLGVQMDTDGARRLNRSSPSCLNSGAQRTDFFHGLVHPLD